MDAPEQLSVAVPQEREAALRARIEQAVVDLAGQLADGHTERFRELLSFYSRFWTYSVRNCLLIQIQYPEAVRCAGRGLWNTMGYHIRKGEKAIWIWAPITRKEEDTDTGQEITVISGFRPAPVFDFAQLAESDERPLLSIVPRLPDDMAMEYQRCLTKVRATGIIVTEEHMYGGTMGVSRGGQIAISPNLDSRNKIFVLLHELTHELWHQQDLVPDPDRTRQQAEFEAESVAFVAATVMGLEHPSARDYLLSWHASPELLHLSLISIQRMVRRVMVVLEIPFDVPATPEALVA